jgi:hypothetical protein
MALRVVGLVASHTLEKISYGVEVCAARGTDVGVWPCVL